jgi:uncharacterized damage-inducible protein DinB
MGLPSCQSDFTVVSNMYCLMASGVTNARQTAAGDALMVVAASATRPRSMLSLRKPQRRSPTAKVWWGAAQSQCPARPGPPVAAGTFEDHVWRAILRTGHATEPPDEALMNTPAIPLAEFDTEMATTRRLLERVPSEKADWKPHPKSFALGHLAQLVSWMPGWITRSLRDTSIDLAGGGGYSIEKTETLLQGFDKSVREAREALASVTGAELDVPWSLKMGPQVLFTAPRGEVVRGHLNHLIHHRGQLSVYLRLVDVPLPSIYGPTADEKWA